MRFGHWTGSWVILFNVIVDVVCFCVSVCARLRGMPCAACAYAASASVYV